LKKLNFNKSVPLISTFFAIIFAIIFWDSISLPYDENNLIRGVSFNEKINPYDNTLKVIFFISFPLAIFLITYTRNNKTLSINPFNKNFFLDKKNCNPLAEDSSNKQINFFSLLLISLVIVEFFTLDFSILLSPIDIYHEGLTLAPSYNFRFFENYWISSHFDWGMGANLRSALFWKVLGSETIGAVRFFDQIIILLNKVLLILICRKISFYITVRDVFKLLFFLFLTISSIHLSNYFISTSGTSGPPIPMRLILFLLFFLFLIESFANKKSFIKNFILGSFSSISFLWYTDIAFYTNAILLIYLFLLFSLRDLRSVTNISLGAIFSWILFFVYFGAEEVNELFFQISSNLNFIYYFNFVEFPKPLSDHYASSRGLKSLLLIIINGIICLHLCLNKNQKINFETKLVLLMTFISSVVLFKSALVRSDTYHIRYASGFIFFSFLINIYLISFYKIQLKKKIIQFFNLHKKYFLPILIISIGLIFILTNESKWAQRLINAKERIIVVLKKDDNHFLNYKAGMWNFGRKYSKTDYDDDKKFIIYYKSLTTKDKCVQNFTEYLGLSFFLKKPTCTKFYNFQFVQPNITEDKFIKNFKTNLPGFILYSSPIVHLDKEGKNQYYNLLKGVPNVDKFINKNYFFYESYLGKWSIYKKK
tara:strand:+ start:371 stop:2323 length:1953 start_codon:yes stop_codon:yes gene_type:complete